MIELFEQYGFRKENRRFAGLLQNCRERLCVGKSYYRSVMRKNEQELCYKIHFDENENDFHFQTSYFIGVDWVDIAKNLKIYVQPKLNDGALEVDYIRMLLDALQEPENLKHIEDLVSVDFSKPYIPITQKQDLLSPFLIAQFLQVLKGIVQKGLKKSYYTVTENLNARVKGKILVGRNIKENLVKGRQIHTICQYQEFGVNCDENKILKKAYQFSRHVIQQIGKGFDSRPLLELINYVHPAFETVTDDIDICKLKTFKSNPLFKEYDQAIKLALLILKRYSYNITKTEQQQVLTPPFWIDMSKLFEIYVLKKLKEVFSERDEVVYHYTVQSKELDFLINSTRKGVQMVVDAKYKPRYSNGSVDLNDYRQLSGYARLKGIYDYLRIDYSKTIDCLIIYPNQTIDDSEKIDTAQKETLPNYVRFYKLGVGLPEIKVFGDQK